jgi:alpha-galactosidase
LAEKRNRQNSVRSCKIPYKPAILIFWALIPITLSASVFAADLTLRNDSLFVKIAPKDGSYIIGVNETAPSILQAGIAAEVDHHWLRSSEYPQHRSSQSTFKDTLGSGHLIAVTFTGLPKRPDLILSLRTYDDQLFGDIQVAVENHTGKTLAVESIRPVEATVGRILNLQGSDRDDRILSDSFSEDWPALRIYDLGKTSDGAHRAVGSQLLYNLQSKQSVFWGALTSDRLLTIMHVTTRAGTDGPAISGFTVDSTGTTEIQANDEESGLHGRPAEDLVELSLPVPNGASVTSERLMFAAGTDYIAQLENYGAAIRKLHHARIAEDNLLGWWSWTAYYTKITEGNALTNALWLAENLKPLGYDYFHFDLGYGYSRNEYTTPNASQFPHGMWPLTHRISSLGLILGVWTAPFEVGARSWVYEHHKDWLVTNRNGKPIQITMAEEMPTEPIFVLDATNPGAQEHLRNEYHTLVTDWGAKFIKLDFMDNTAIEGDYFRPNTTALEAQRIGLQIIRGAVGEHVLLDKDGSPMLNPVGLVDEGRTSQDTGHLFVRSKEAAPGIAARFYMQRNFFMADPDAFTVSRQLMEEREIQLPLTLSEAEVSIALSAVSGGMYEIGDDLPTLGADEDRVALLKNPDLLQMAKFGRASIPLDLLSYRAEDEQASVFLLKEDRRQSILTVFNWTEQTRSHAIPIAQLNLSSGHKYELRNILWPADKLTFDGDSIRVDQPAHSVKLIKFIDTTIPAAAPSVDLQAADHAKISEDLKFTCAVASEGIPAFAYHWIFGDGTSEDGRQVTHTYTRAGNFTVKLVVDGMDGIAAEKTATVAVSGAVTLPPPSRYRSNE